MASPIDLSKAQARRLVLASQGLFREADFGRGRNGVVNTALALSYVQIDTISVVERAHHHTLWNRVKGYQAKHLDQAVAAGELFEYWSHAAAFLPMQGYRYSLPRKQSIASGERHWYDKDPKQAAYVLDKIRAEGALQAKDFAQSRSIKRDGWGDQKPAKRALEQLFMEGELMVSKRQGFQKVFDLSERVLPQGVDTSMPSSDEYFDYLIFSTLKANGLASVEQIIYLRKGIKPDVQARCLALLEDKRLCVIRVGGKNYYALPSFSTVLNKKISRTRIKILSPFDNLLIQRQRMRDLFDFDYQIECYVPANKRKHGYFVLPILWGHQFAGRLDAKIDRKTGMLDVLKLYIETPRDTQFSEALNKELASFTQFNGGKQFKISNTVRL